MAVETSAQIRPLSEDTRKCLLYTAGEVFAEYGFRAATVREICRRAAVNVASINYHFGSKEELYVQVLEFSLDQAAKKYPYSASVDDPPEKRLGNFILSFMQGCLDRGRAAWHGKIMAREMVEPTGVLKRVVERAIRPRNLFLNALVKEILGDGFSDDEVALAAFSVIGQCVFYNHSRPVITQLNPRVTYDEEGITRTAAHITEFSLAALKRLSRGRKGAK